MINSEKPIRVMIAGIGGASLGTEIYKSLYLAGNYEIFGCDVSATAYGLYEAGFFNPDIGVLAWWPKIIRRPLLAMPKQGFINTHPSLLPYNRGKHYNFWALVEQAPFGVSLHFVEEETDSGDIVTQANLPYDWGDNGATLYAKACHETVRLFKETYPIIRTLTIPRHKQDLSQGSFHYAWELEPASVIDLDQHYKARDLLNLIRARTFPGHPACWFSDAGSDYEVRIEIKRKA